MAVRLERYQEAIGLYHRVLAIDPDAIMTYLYLMEAQLLAELRPAALATARTLVERVPPENLRLFYHDKVRRSDPMNVLPDMNLVTPVLAQALQARAAADEDHARQILQSLP